MITEMINFFIDIFENNLDEFLEELTRLQETKPYLFDYTCFYGEINSILFNDAFWEHIMLKIVSYKYIYMKLTQYKFTLVEKTNEAVKALMPDHLQLRVDLANIQVEFSITDFIKLHWNDQLKEPVQKWVIAKYRIYDEIDGDDNPPFDQDNFNKHFQPYEGRV